MNKTRTKRNKGVKLELTLKLQEAAIKVYGEDPFLDNKRELTVWGRYAIYIVLRNEGYSTYFIGDQFGKDHASVHQALKKHPDNLKFSVQYSKLFQQFLKVADMPEVNKIIKLSLTPEQFLDACSPNELQELDLLLQSNYYQGKMGRGKKVKKPQFPADRIMINGKQDEKS